MYSVVSRTHDLHGLIGRDFLQLSDILSCYPSQNKLLYLILPPLFLLHILFLQKNLHQHSYVAYK